jgi:predicted SprT family Zn-dependent metalloprotease
MNCKSPALSRNLGSGASLQQVGKEVKQMKTNPWHSKKETDRKVYHDNTSCTEGNNIEKQNVQSGTGSRPRCQHCAQLDK